MKELLKWSKHLQKENTRCFAYPMVLSNFYEKITMVLL